MSRSYDAELKAIVAMVLERPHTGQRWLHVLVSPPENPRLFRGYATHTAKLQRVIVSAPEGTYIESIQVATEELLCGPVPAEIFFEGQDLFPGMGFTVHEGQRLLLRFEEPS